MVKKIFGFKGKTDGFTLVEIMVSLVISAFLSAAVYNFFISQNHAYSVQDQVVELEQNSRATINMIKQEIRMAGYNAMGTELINNLSNWVPSGFIPTSPTYPFTVNLDANPKVTAGIGTSPDVITFLSVLMSENNPTTFTPIPPTAPNTTVTQLTLSLNATDTNSQYNVGDIIHIGTCSEYAKVTGISGNVLTIDTNPTTSGNQGLKSAYNVVSIGGVTHKPPIGEISVVSYAVFNDSNDSTYTYHEQGHPVLKRKINSSGFDPVAENVTDMQIADLGSGEMQLTLQTRTDKPDSELSTNNGYRVLDTSTKIKIRNTNTITGGSTCAVAPAPSNLTLSGLDSTYPCKIHITWTAPAAVTGCPITGYTIYYDDEAGFYANSVSVPASLNSYDLVINNPTYPAPLQACTYYVSVAAVNSGGTGAKVTTSIADSLAPAAPAGLTAVNVNGIERSVRLSWTANTDCDLNGYNIYRKTAGGSYNYATPVNTSLILKSSIFATDAILPTPSDCATYYYVIRAVDICPNASVDSNEVSAAVTAPAPPTNGNLSGNVLSWTLSTDDQVVPLSGIDYNYVKNYKVYGVDNANNLNLLATPSAGVTSYTYTGGIVYSSYRISAIGYCNDLESTKLVISSACIESPTISNILPASGSTIGGTQIISGTVTPPLGRTTSSVQIKIDSAAPVNATLNSSNFSYTWNTNTYSNSIHTIRLTATDDQGCNSSIDFTVTVNNDLNNCPDKPTVTIISPAPNATVSGMQTISGTVYANGSKTVSSVTVKINDVAVSPVTIASIGGIYANFSYDWNCWDTSKYSQGNYPIKITAVDSADCTSTSLINVNVNMQLYCKLYVCKDSGNVKAYVAAYVYDVMKQPISNATVTIKFSANSSTITGTTASTGWFTGTNSCIITGTKYTSTATIEPESTLTPPSTLAESSHKMNSGDTITVTATKTGLLTSAQSSIKLTN